MNAHAQTLLLLFTSTYLILDALRTAVKLRRRRRWGPSQDELDAAVGTVQHFIRSTNRESPDDRVLAIRISGLGSSTEWENDGSRR